MEKRCRTSFAPAALGFDLKIFIDDDISFGVYHDQALTVLYHEKADFRSCARVAGRVDHDINEAAVENRFRILRYGNLAASVAVFRSLP